MRLPWLNSGPAPVDAPTAPSGEQPCPTLKHALDALFRQKPKPEILDLGPLCGDTLVYLADRGARVAVEEFQSPPAIDPDSEALPARLRIDQDDERFDLILAWEHFDFVDDTRVEAFTAELRRLLVPGGRVLMISMNSSPTAPVTSGRPARYRMTADDQVCREELPGEVRGRFCRPNRDIERAIAPLTVEKLHLHRNQMREFLAVRPLPKRKN